MSDTLRLKAKEKQALLKLRDELATLRAEGPQVAPEDKGGCYYCNHSCDGSCASSCSGNCKFTLSDEPQAGDQRV